MNTFESWGRYPKTRQQMVALHWRDQISFDYGDQSVLPVGNGRSYGDVCLNDGGVLLNCRGLDRLIAFDPDTGILRCEAGVLLADILAFAVPKGWFLPVTPGTRFVSVGGAIANDVHGKNHHCVGTFGCHLRAFELLRSDGSLLLCSAKQNADWFAATIGGLGLTGVILWAEIQLKPIQNPAIAQEVIRYQRLAEFFSLVKDSDQDFDYTVAWIDCLAKQEHLGRGLFIRGNHANHLTGRSPKAPRLRLSFPIDPPITLVNSISLRLLNTVYYRKQLAERQCKLVHYEPFFYPLDAIQHWNRVYGRKGLLQYQCVIPLDQAETAMAEILARIAAAGMGSFLAVLKIFGQIASPGLLAFARPGATLALDFPNQGQRTLTLLDQLDEVTRQAGGALNPSKDSRMRAQDFQQGFPNWQDFSSFIDPCFSSSFWRRVSQS